MVAEQARRGGIGRRLIATAEDWSASIGAACNTGAAGFYLALGYTESAAFFRKLTTTTEPGVRAKGTSGLYGLPRRHLTGLRVSSWHFALVATDAK
jgi:GNAT superfamily N-acetyltransferase